MATVDSRRRFLTWIERKLNDKTCPGLEWYDHKEKMFRVPWSHFNRSDNVATHFHVFKEWAIFTGSHRPGEREDYPKWKRNFRCALYKDTGVTEVLQLRSGKFTAAPYRIYKFISPNTTPTQRRRHKCSRSDKGKGGDLEEKKSDMFRYCPAGAEADMVMDSTSEESEESNNKMVTSTTYADDECPRGACVNIPSVIQDFVSWSVKEGAFLDKVPRNVTKADDQPEMLMVKGKLEQQQNQLNNQSVIFTVDVLIDIDRTKHNARKDKLCGVSHRDFNACFIEDSSSSADTSYVVFRDSAGNTLDKTGETKELNVGSTANKLDENIDEDSSMPSDLASINSGDLMRPSSNTGLSILPPTNQQEMDKGKKYTQQPIPAFPQVTTEHGGIVIKVFYGSPHQKVLEQFIPSSAHGCRIYFGEPMLNLPYFDEKMYGSRELIQISLPTVQCFDCITDKQKELLDSILKEMHRGVLLTIYNGDIFAKRLCRTRAFVYDQNKSNRVLNRKSNQPEKIFDIARFQSELDRQLAEATTKDNIDPFLLNPPAPHVYLTFGNQFPLDESVKHKVLVSMTVSSCTAEEMVAQVGTRMGQLQSTSGPFVSTMDTLDRLLDDCKSMSLN